MWLSFGTQSWNDDDLVVVVTEPVSSRWIVVVVVGSDGMVDNRMAIGVTYDVQ
jgi:hypothetical protein